MAAAPRPRRRRGPRAGRPSRRPPASASCRGRCPRPARGRPPWPPTPPALRSGTGSWICSAPRLRLEARLVVGLDLLTEALEVAQGDELLGDGRQRAAIVRLQA